MNIFLATVLTFASGAVSQKASKVFKAKTEKDLLYDCSINDIIYFNFKYAELVDLMCEAAQSRALLVAANSTEGTNDYLTGDRTEAELQWFDFMNSHADDESFTVKIDSYRRTVEPADPVLSISYPDLDSFLNGYSTGIESNPYYPGFYAFQTFRESGPLVINGNGGASGYHKCNNPDGTATSTYRTIDGLASLGSYSPNVVAFAKLYLTWKNVGGTWLIKEIRMVADQMGIITYP